MNILKRFLTAICLTAFLICLSGNIKAKADAIEASEVISNLVTGADLTSISYAYNNLSSQQKYIANYLMGAYNYAYFCARGFSFDIDQTETNMKAQLGAIGERVWQYVTTAYGWRSRFNEVFRQYASSIIVYSSKITVTFSTWIDEILAGTRNVYIEYSEDALDAWTVFYNDPSGDGIASFGREISAWDSGEYFDFGFVGRAWRSTSDESMYNTFILNNNPVLYTNIARSNYQCVVQPLVNGHLADTFFILRSLNNVFSQGKFGYYDLFATQPNSTEFRGVLVAVNNSGYLQTNEVQTSTRNLVNYSGGTSLENFLQYAFSNTPLQINNYDYGFFNWYPFIEHVILVDDLTTLSNPEEIYNVEDFNITAPAMDNYIITPNGKMLIPGYAPMTDPFADLWDISVDINNNPSNEDDFNTQIVNNTVINNYIVDDGDKINVPVEWFDNEYTEQLNFDSQPFFTFVRDCIRSLGDLQVYFYGAIVIGLGGGILKKFLL